LTGLAVKVTGVPEHIFVADAPMVTEGVTEPVTEIVTGFDVTKVGDAQVRVDTITQVTTSPFARVEFE
jgi:hypothetical protein